MPAGRRLISVAVRVLAACVVAFVLLVAVVALAEVENNSTGDDIAETIYQAIWVVAGLALVALVVGGLSALRERSR